MTVVEGAERVSTEGLRPEPPWIRLHQASSLRERVLEDSRSPIGRRHLLEDILVITLCATFCGADSYVEVAEWGQAHEAWLETFLELPHGIPSHDTFTRVFWVLHPEQLGACFTC